MSSSLLQVSICIHFVKKYRSIVSQRCSGQVSCISYSLGCAGCCLWHMVQAFTILILFYPVYFDSMANNINFFLFDDLYILLLGRDWVLLGLRSCLPWGGSHLPVCGHFWMSNIPLVLLGIVFSILTNPDKLYLLVNSSLGVLILMVSLRTWFDSTPYTSASLIMLSLIISGDPDSSTSCFVFVTNFSVVILPYFRGPYFVSDDNFVAFGFYSMLLKTVDILSFSSLLLKVAVLYIFSLLSPTIVICAWLSRLVYFAEWPSNISSHFCWNI